MSQTGLVSGNAQNAPGGSTAHNRSKFPFSYSRFATERFAEYCPFDVMEGVSGDRLPLYSSHEVQTYTLKSPIIQSLSKKKDFFVVPMQAILPLNWEKFYTNPNIGQDVPDDVGLAVSQFWHKMRDLFYRSWTALTGYPSSSPTPSNVSILERLLKFLVFFERIYSTGSLMETLGISGHNWYRCIHSVPNTSVNETLTYDEFFDYVFGQISTQLAASSSNYFTLSYNGGATVYVVVSNPDSSNVGSNRITLREAIELMRDDLSFSVGFYVVSGSTTPAATLVNSISSAFNHSLYDSDAPLNLGRLWAYQLCCFHFYSNDHIDYIYSAELFRQYVRQISTRLLVSGPMAVGQFSVNGMNYEYDALSAHVFDEVITGFGNTSGIFLYGNNSSGQGSSSDYERSDSLDEALAYFRVLFGFNRSLRFMDYFTGSRAFPLAVGDHEVQVGTITPGKLDIIELSRTSMMTKFLQAVNRAGRKFSNYMQELFGKTPAYDYHNPMYLAHISDFVGAAETENTGAAQVTAQLAVTSRLRATSSKYAFEFEPDRDCIVIGITYYDLPRVYLNATERQNFVVNRFDMFNPYLQFIGDQDISEAEIGTDTPDVGKPFSYTNKDMQYKQRYNQASGGFCVPSTGLDNWIFPADMLQRRLFHNISPSFIRSFNSEVDRFYQSLTGYSLGTYFHFIVRYDNRMDASREMAYNPIIAV